MAGLHSFRTLRDAVYFGGDQRLLVTRRHHTSDNVAAAFFRNVCTSLPTLRGVTTHTTADFVLIRDCDQHN